MQFHPWVGENTQSKKNIQSSLVVEVNTDNVVECEHLNLSRILCHCMFCTMSKGDMIRPKQFFIFWTSTPTSPSFCRHKAGATCQWSHQIYMDFSKVISNGELLQSNRNSLFLCSTI